MNKQNIVKKILERKHAKKTMFYHKFTFNKWWQPLGIELINSSINHCMSSNDFRTKKTTLVLHRGTHQKYANNLITVNMYK